MIKHLIPLNISQRVREQAYDYERHFTFKIAFCVFRFVLHRRVRSVFIFSEHCKLSEDAVTASHTLAVAQLCHLSIQHFNIINDVVRLWCWESSSLIALVRGSVCAPCAISSWHMNSADEPGSAVCPLGGGKHSGSSDWLAAVCHSVDVCVRFNAYASASVCKCIYLKKKNLLTMCVHNLFASKCVCVAEVGNTIAMV